MTSALGGQGAALLPAQLQWDPTHCNPHTLTAQKIVNDGLRLKRNVALGARR
jgi:hypothetical protein